MCFPRQTQSPRGALISHPLPQRLTHAAHLGAIVRDFDRSPWPARLFVLIALPITLLMAQIMPLGRMPDETAHVFRADSIRHLQLIGRRDSGASPVPRAYLLSDPAFSQIGYVLPLPPGPQHFLTADILSIQQSAQWHKPQDIEVPNTASYSPVMYLPAALGLGIGRAIRASPYNSWVLARFLSAGVFVACGALALHSAPRWWTFAVLCLPMTLSLASSVNPDALNLAVLALSLALLERDRRILAAVLMSAVIAQRPTLLPLSLLFLLPLGPRAELALKSPWRRVREVLVAALPPLAWVALAQARATVEIIRTPQPYAAGPLWPGDHNALFASTNGPAQIKVLLAHPLLLVTLPLDTIVDDFWLRCREVIGVLGALELVLPPCLYVFAWCGLAAAALADVTNRSRTWPQALDAVLTLVVLCSGVLLTYLTIYLIWNQVGYPEIEGVQGRYFLPYLLAGLFALPMLPARLGVVAPFAAAATAMAVGVVTLVWPESVVRYFYIA
jgi:Predicted membrane protein (DUF2142)